MTAYTGTPPLPAGLAGDIPNAATDWAAILGALHGLTDAWSAWTPTWSNLTVGNGTVLARYRQVGKTVDYRIKFTLGTTSVVGTSPNFTLPVAPTGGFIADDMIGLGHGTDASINTYVLGVFYNGSGIARFNISATVPFTFGNSDWFESVFTYETT